MAVWVVRAGRRGEQELFALENNLAVIGWDEIGDLGPTKSREDIQEIYERVHPEDNRYRIGIQVGQLYRFRHGWKVGELVVLPLKVGEGIAVGRIAGEYSHRPEGPEGCFHARPVQWIRTDIPRTQFPQDLRYAFGSLLTVSRVRKEKAEQRILAVIAEKAPPEPPPSDEEEKIDLSENAKNEIKDHIILRFQGRELEYLVGKILEAQGYVTDISPAGRDEGVDIIAGRGPMGFDPPRLCVQVKSGENAVGREVLDRLQGVLSKFGADQGLLVSWYGFTADARNEARKSYFKVRLWTADDLLTAIFENYDKLSEHIQARIPLKRVWMLVPEEE